MNEFTLLFVLVLILMMAVKFWLAQRQISHVNAHRDTLPPAFASRISLQDHQLAADYTVARTRLGRWELFYGSVLLLLWTLGGGLAWLNRLWLDMPLPSLWQATGLLLSFALLAGLLDLPFSWYRTFQLEQRFGFNRNTPTLFIIDLLKGTLLLLLLGAPLAALVLWLMDSAGSWWWFYVWLVWQGFGLLLMWAYPAFIAPLFNKFSPLENTSLSTRIEQLLQRSGFTAAGLYVMDGSRRSAHGNAYFTGLGRHKRVVFFDTLLERLGDDEIEAVLAHELGHFHHRHIRQRLILNALFSLLGLALLGQLTDASWFYQGLGVTQPSMAMALLLFLLVMPVFSFFLQPLLAQRMRKHEFEADEFAARQSSASDLINALVKLYQDNASTLTPDPLHSAFYDSHPPASARIAQLQQ
ncbi:MAG: M48 family metallopeptidase [Thiohalomonadaceae bacterium]